jgi:RNA polymerase sigma-70 factor (ECF subfamily)
MTTITGTEPADRSVALDSSEPTVATLTIEDVWRDFAGPLHGFVHRRVADRHAVDDIVAEVMLRIHTHLDRLDDHEKVTAWVFRIARNAITDHYRRTARRPDAPSDLPEGHPDGDGDVDQWVDDQDLVIRELSVVLRPLVDQLPDDYRRALELTDLGGMSQAEAARIEQVSVSGMKSRVQRGRRLLVARLHQHCEITFDSRGMPADCTPRADGCGCDFAPET